MGCNPWPRGPNVTGGYQLDGRVSHAAGAGAGRAAQPREIQNPPPAATAGRSERRSSACCSRTSACARCPTRSTQACCRCRMRTRRSMRSSSRARRSSRAPAGIATVAPGNRRRRHRWSAMHDISTQCPRPVDTRRRPARFNFAPCPPRLARNARTYEITLANGTQMRRTSSDPGRALLTGFVGGPPGQDDWNKFDMPGLRGMQLHGTVLSQQQRRHAGRSGRSLLRVLQARAGRRAAGRRAAGRDHRRRELRSSAQAGRTRRVAGVSAQALG